MYFSYFTVFVYTSIGSTKVTPQILILLWDLKNRKYDFFRNHTSSRNRTIWIPFSTIFRNSHYLNNFGPKIKSRYSEFTLFEYLRTCCIVSWSQNCFWFYSTIIHTMSMKCTNPIPILVLAVLTGPLGWFKIRICTFHRHTRVKLKCVLWLGDPNASLVSWEEIFFIST